MSDPSRYFSNEQLRAATELHEQSLKPEVPDKRNPISILVVICREFSVSPAVILSKDRHISIAIARQAAMLIFRDLGYSFPEIGRFLERDHTTIIHGSRSARRLFERDTGYQAKINLILEQIK